MLEIVLPDTNWKIIYCGGISGTFALLILLYFLWKNIFGKENVNCWFCNVDSIVLHKLKNKWTCSHCHQYNGFDKHGNYNKILPEMFDEKLNTKYVAQQSLKKENDVHPRAKLCDKCSRNQILKYKQLAQFKPIIESNFSLEVEAFERKLDRLYSLCSSCQESSRRYIKWQDTILRGRMMTQRQKLEKQQNRPSLDHAVVTPIINLKRNKAIAVLFQVLMFMFALSHALVVVQGCVENGVKFAIFPSSFYEVKLFSNFSGLLLTNGLALSVMILYLKSLPFSKSGSFYLFLWLISSALFAFEPSNDSTNYVDDLIQFYSNKANQQYLKSNNFGPVIVSMIRVMLQLFFCFVLLISCCFNIFRCVLLSVKIENSTLQLKNQNDDVKESDVASDDFCPKLGEELYSDDNKSIIDDNEKNDDDQLTVANSGLNGSLNALKLQDKQELNALFQNFKNPNDVFGVGSLPSALHTPPPSRSSSLLSLASHTSASSGIGPRLGSSYSTVHFARPSTELPFQRFKTNSAIATWNQSSKLLKPSFRSGFRAGVNVRNNLHKPLISPAKLNRFSKIQDSFHSQALGGRKNIYRTDSDHDVSVFDSVSQCGDGGYPELSDDEELPQTPTYEKQEYNSNSSSPKSTISNITSITMKSVAEVENSRVCRWILAVCLLVNLVLVILLVLEVKEMREMEQWKSRNSL